MLRRQVFESVVQIAWEVVFRQCKPVTLLIVNFIRSRHGLSRMLNSGELWVEQPYEGVRVSVVA